MSILRKLRRRAPDVSKVRSQEASGDVQEKLAIQDLAAVKDLVAETVARLADKNQRQDNKVSVEVQNQPLLLTFPPFAPGVVRVDLRQQSDVALPSEVVNSIKQGVEGGYHKVASKIGARTQLPPPHTPQVNFVVVGAEPSLGTGVTSSSTLPGKQAAQAAADQRQGPTPNNRPTPTPGK